MRRLKNRITYLTLCILLTGWGQAPADDNHYVNMIIGNRASGLAGAYTAISDDPSGCYYNPAGIAFAPSLSLSASVNAFGVSIKTYKSVLTETSGNKKDWEQTSTSLLPNFFGVVRKVGTGMLGLTYAVSDSIQRRQKQYFQNLYSADHPDNAIATYMVNINDSDKTYLFGPSYAYPFSDTLSVGGTLYMYYRDREIIRNQLFQYEQGEHILINFYETQLDKGVKPIIGVMWEPLDVLSIGVSMSKGFIVSNDTQQHTIYRNTVTGAPVILQDGMEYDFSDTDAIFFQGVNSSDKADLPFSITLGAAYFFSTRMLFSGDLSWFQSTDEKKSVFNISLGTEYYATESLAIRFGLYTDHANTPEVSSGSVSASESNRVPEHIDIYGTSFSMTFFHKMSSITLGMLYGFGTGDAQVIEGRTETYDTEMHNINVYLSASYNY